MARSTSSRPTGGGSAELGTTEPVYPSYDWRSCVNALKDFMSYDGAVLVPPSARHLATHATVVAACAVAAALGCAGAPRRAVSSGALLSGALSVQSNVARGDYVGSSACAACHTDIAAAWEHSPMHRMTRDPGSAEIRAPFDGTKWRFKEDVLTLERRHEGRFVRIESAPGDGASTPVTKTYRVTRVIGGRTREDFAGVEVGGSAEEVVLPVSFVFATRALRYKGYSVMLHERASLRAGPVWSRACIFCHNTVPELDRLLGAIAGPGAHGYQGEEVERWLPVERRLPLRVTDVGALATALGAEVVLLGGTAPRAGEGVRHLAKAAIDVVRTGFDGSDLIESGIGCEACHGGSREHVRNPGVHPSLARVAPWLDDSARGASHASQVNRVCARCHQVLFSQYPFTWEGGRRDASAGGSHINSGEARDFLLGGCASAMACTTCHDPHGADAPSKMRALATPAGNTTCTSCHREFGDDERLRTHAHHDPTGAGGSCIACHMPRKNMGLDGALTRYHRIGSPTDPARVLGDRPLECTLCHADQSVGALVQAMEKWWPVRYPRQRLEELYGSLDANVIRATLERGKPHEQAVAIGVLKEAGARDAVPLIARQLGNEYPLVREWAQRALEALGAPPQPTHHPAPGAARDADAED